jgi:hypothetical protein
MKQMKILGVVTIALALGLTACGGTKKCDKHKWGDWTVVKEETCTEKGLQERKCTVCGEKQEKDIAAAHKWGEWNVTKEATCQEVGSRTHTCSRCNQTETEEIPLADHSYGEFEVTTAATCTTDGEEKRVCSVCGDEDTQTIAALGHSYVKDADGNDVVTWTTPVACEVDGVGTKHCERCNEDVAYTTPKLGHHLVQQADDGTAAKEDFAKVRVYECDREGCDYATFGFSAQEVSSASGRLVDEEVTEGETVLHGKRFWGRPIGNNMELTDDGSAANGADTPKVFDRSVQGDLFEYKFTLTQDQVDALGSDIACYADAKPADYLGGQDFWACDPSAEEWTPGYYIDDAHEDQTPIADYRYILYVDGSPVEFDHNITAPVPRGSGYSSTNLPRGEFIMPYIFHFAAGDHSISLRMAGGYRSIFFNFIFKSYEAPEPPEPQHVHSWVEDTPVAGGEGKVGYTQAHCSEDTAKRLSIATLDENKVFNVNPNNNNQVSSNKSGTPAPFMKLNKDGDSVTYTFNYAGSETSAKLNFVAVMDGWGSSSNKSATFYNGDSTRMEITVNGTVIDQSALKEKSYETLFANGQSNGELGSSYSNIGEIEMGAMTLKNGENVITIKRVVTLNVLVSNMNIVF